MNQPTISVYSVFLAKVFLVIAASITLSAQVQAQSEFTTEWGDPDLRGLWTNATLTPLERPAALADKTHFTEAEAEAIKGTGVATIVNTIGRTGEGKVTGELSETWLETGTEVVRSRRTSLIVDPPNGKVPHTPGGQMRRMQEFGKRFGGASAASYKDLHSQDRCLHTGTIYWTNPFYNSLHQIFQTRDHVVMLSEWGPHRRIIPIDDRPPLDESFSLWDGSSRGHWEGNTLVVETANFNGHNSLQGGTAATHFTERFTRFDKNTIDYSLTTTDPASFTQPWTIENTMRVSEGPMLEFACHEGNYGLVNVLSGARATDRAALRAKDAKDAKDG
jgi:hypothetical protein